MWPRIIYFLSSGCISIFPNIYPFRAFTFFDFLYQDNEKPTKRGHETWCSGQGQVAGTLDCSNEHSAPIKCGKFLHHHHKRQGLDPLIRSVSRVTVARANASSVFQLFSFLVVCSGMISKGFGFVAFFASVKAGSVCIHLSCLVCL